MPISAVLKNYGSITEYLRVHNSDKNGPFEISKKYIFFYFKYFFLALSSIYTAFNIFIIKKRNSFYFNY
jgi:hypothetical protein